MSKQLLVLAFALGISTAACSGQARGAGSSTTAHAARTTLLASAEPASYRDIPFVIDAAPASPKGPASSARPDLERSSTPSYDALPFVIEAAPRAAKSSTPARWYRSTAGQTRFAM